MAASRLSLLIKEEVSWRSPKSPECPRLALGAYKIPDKLTRSRRATSLLSPRRSADLRPPASALPGPSEDVLRPSVVTVSPLVSTSKFTPPESHPTLWVRVSGVVTVLLPLAGENVRRALGSEIPSVGVAARTRDSSQRAGGGWAGGWRWGSSGLVCTCVSEREQGGAPAAARPAGTRTLVPRATQPAPTLIPRCPCVLPGHGCHSHDCGPETHLRGR